MSLHAAGVNPIQPGQKIKAEWMEYVEDTLDAHTYYAEQRSCFLATTTAQNVVITTSPGSTLQMLHYDTDVTDTLNEYSVVNYKFVALAAGNYFFSVGTFFADDPTPLPAGSTIQVHILQNRDGVGTISFLSGHIATVDAAGTSQSRVSSASGVFVLEAGDEVYPYVTLTSDTADTYTTSNIYGHNFSGFRIV